MLSNILLAGFVVYTWKLEKRSIKEDEKHHAAIINNLDHLPQPRGGPHRLSDPEVAEVLKYIYAKRKN